MTDTLIAPCRTQMSLHRWTSALPALVYSVTLMPSDRQGRPEKREYTAGQLVAAAPFLRHRNARGANIYVRPGCGRHLLVDDLDLDGLGMITSRHRVAAVVESSPWSYQAWLSVTEEPLDPGLASSAARLLARRYGGDPGAASALQHGRAPGLTNRKPIHERGDGSYPWAILHHAEPGTDPAGAALLEEARAALSRAPAAIPRRAYREPSPIVSRSPAEEHRACADVVCTQIPPGMVPDQSRVDYAIARRLLRRGMTLADAEAAVLAGAKASSMRRLAAEAYARRTAEAAARDAGGWAQR